MAFELVPFRGPQHPAPIICKASFRFIARHKLFLPPESNRSGLARASRDRLELSRCRCRSPAPRQFLRISFLETGRTQESRAFPEEAFPSPAVSAPHPVPERRKPPD